MLYEVITADPGHRFSESGEVLIVEDLFREVAADFAQQQEGVTETALVVEQGPFQQQEEVGALLGQQTLFELLQIDRLMGDFQSLVIEAVEGKFLLSYNFV